jgi:hypothetical protein
LAKRFVTVPPCVAPGEKVQRHPLAFVYAHMHEDSERLGLVVSLAGPMSIERNQSISSRDLLTVYFAGLVRSGAPRRCTVVAEVSADDHTGRVEHLDLAIGPTNVLPDELRGKREGIVIRDRNYVADRFPIIARGRERHQGAEPHLQGGGRHNYPKPDVRG